jgi:hypothetical protein
MKVVVDKPPNFEQIVAKFPLAEGKVLFAWGETIYNPQGIHIPNYLLAHEAIHGMRQLGKIAGGDGDPLQTWWTKYIEDEEFRFQEELAAHRVEFAVLSQELRDRNARAKLLMATAARLVAPLYGYSNKKLLEAQRALQS